MKDAYQIILQPLITEKSTILREDNKYAFVVDRNATKPQIRRAAEELFDLQGDILKVRTMHVRGKPKGKMLRYQRGRKPHWKKAILTLREGVTIQAFETI
ncbi:50S ribosomal protein L23 [Candidatus Poribacteria bacterium]|nr:50S ribosomal protein L23 [Candidatus Poribacteria bacterium]MDE0682263.1 50S ribosomal protein L23 [Candidatus Poribacteria bacterium]MXV73419.1 50S ribosomal protein L23 [Candidatus Poribacteria bacterium]